MKHFGWICAFLACLFLPQGVIWAQSTAQVNGAVTDQSGATLPGVEVTATQTDTGLLVRPSRNGEDWIAQTANSTAVTISTCRPCTRPRSLRTPSCVRWVQDGECQELFVLSPAPS